MDQNQPLSVNTKEHYKAIESEFNLSINKTSDEIADKARTDLARLLPEASETLQEILHSGCKDDAVRLSAVKLVFEYTLGKPMPTGTKESDMDKIIKSLMTPNANAEVK